MGSQWRAIKIGVTWDIPEDKSHFSENIAGVKLPWATNPLQLDR